MMRNINEALGRYLSIRARSEGEVRDYLLRKSSQYQLSEEKIETLIFKYKNLGFINDGLFVEALTHASLGKGKGQAFIRAKLRQAHVSGDLIAQGLAETDPAEIMRAMEKRLRRYVNKWSELEPKIRRQKAYTALFSSGFAGSDIRSFIDVWLQKEYNDTKL